MQRKIDEYLVSRRIVEKFRQDFENMLFHGMSSRSLPSVNRRGALLSPRDLEKVGDYSIRTERGRYESIGKRPPRDVRDEVVSVTKDIRTALRYAEEDRLKRLSDRNYLNNVELDLFKISQEYKGVSLGWPATYAFSNVRAFLSALRKGYHNVGKVPHFPVLVAVPAVGAPELELVDPKIRAERVEQGLVQIPAHMAYFFVPDEHLPTARRLLWRYKRRVLPLSLLYKIAEEKGVKIWGE